MKQYSAEMRQYLDEMRRYENWRYGNDRLRRIWDETNYLADSIARKYVKIDDLIEELRENGIALA